MRRQTLKHRPINRAGRDNRLRQKLQLPDRFTLQGLGAPVWLLAVTLVFAGTAYATHSAAGARVVGSVGSAQVVSLKVVAAPTPRFDVPRYDTSGTYPQVRDAGLDLRAVNAALRAGVLADQREYAPDARKHSVGTAKSYRGVYRTSIDRRLLSASTVVVSALMPATKLYPGGNEGQTWVAVTVRVPSGEHVTITDLFADPRRGLRVLAKAWDAQVRRAEPEFWRRCVKIVPTTYLPTARNYRYFALTPRGLALGFWQAPACSRSEATVPYAILRPHLSKLGAELIAGVRSPR